MDLQARIATKAAGHGALIGNFPCSEPASAREMTNGICVTSTCIGPFGCDRMHNMHMCIIVSLKGVKCMWFAGLGTVQSNKTS